MTDQIQSPAPGALTAAATPAPAASPSNCGLTECAGKQSCPKCIAMTATPAPAPAVTDDMRAAVRWAPSSAHWSTVLCDLFGPDAREGIAWLEQRARDAEAALREAQSKAPAVPRSLRNEKAIVYSSLNAIEGILLDVQSGRTPEKHRVQQAVREVEHARQATKRIAPPVAAQPIAVGTIRGRFFDDGTRAGNTIEWDGRRAEDDFPDGTILYTVAAPQAPRWWKCDTHGPAKAGAWGCPECVREMRDEIAQLRAAPQAPQQNDDCFCDRTGLGVPGVSCGDCPRDYRPAPQQADGQVCARCGGIVADPVIQQAPQQAPSEPVSMPAAWSVDVNVGTGCVLSIGNDWVSGEPFSGDFERTVLGAAQHLLSFIGYGLPPCSFDPDDEQTPQQAEPLFLLHTGKIDSGGEQDEWETEADSQTRVDAFCAAHPGQTIGLYPGPVPSAGMTHASAWQPIETAPKDGTKVLAWNAEYGARETQSITYTPGSIGFEQGLTDRWWEWLEPKNNWALRWSPTHWMPMPAPPESDVQVTQTGGGNG